MKVEELIKLAEQCDTEDKANALLSVLLELNTTAIGQLRAETYNEEAFLEAPGNPCISFDACHELSSHYVVSFSPNLRDGDYSIRVRIDQMDDGKGTASQNWHTVEGMEHVIEACPDDNIGSLAVTAIEKAVEFHVELILRTTGASESYAKDIAKHIWQ